jgi:hypothetical protein
MRTSPSIVPYEADQDTYLVLEDFGRMGCYWRQTDADNADRETLIRGLVEGQYSHPVRIVAFNSAEDDGLSLIKYRSKASQACSAAASVLNGEPMTFTAGLFW